MDKRKALVLLVTQSLFLTDKSKKIILDNIDNLSEEEVMKMGRLLALEKESSLKVNAQLENILTELLKEYV